MTELLLLLLLTGELTQEEFLTQAPQARVVYLGEHHDSAADHQGQLELLELLQPEAVGFEMFERSEQAMLDESSLDDIQTQWRWGFAWELYAPLLDWGRSHGARLLGLNAPRAEVRQVARGELPPPADVAPGPEPYREKLLKVWQQHQGPPDGFERFFAAQCLWDETMARSLATYLEHNPQGRVAVIVGAGHVEHGYGIPGRVARLLPGISQLRVLFGAAEDGAADYVVKPR